MVDSDNVRQGDPGLELRVLHCLSYEVSRAKAGSYPCPTTNPALCEGDYTRMMKSARKSDGIVYSTELGRMCPLCRQPIGQCSCAKRPSAPVSDGVVRVSRETKGRNGKAVTVIRGLTLDPGALVALGGKLKTACGAGGTVKDGLIEVQGDHCERVIEYLAAQGWTVKRAGG